MREVRPVPVVVLAVLAVLGGTVVSTAGPAPAASDAAGGAASPANNSSMGLQVSGFMQSSTGETSEAVESGMWNAAYGRAETRPARAAVVADRSDDIEARIGELQREKRALIAARKNGTIGAAEFHARMSRIVGRLAELNRSIDETERQARASGADVSRVQRLREAAGELSGPEIATIARSIAGRGPDDLPPQARGPDDGPRGNETGQGKGKGKGEGQGNEKGGKGKGKGQGQSKD